MLRSPFFRYVLLPWGLGVLTMLAVLLTPQTVPSSRSVGSVHFVSYETVDLPRAPMPEQVTLPFFPGCDQRPGDAKRACSTEKMYEYVYRNTKFPAGSPSQRTAGIVTLDFMVNARGQIGDIKVVRAPDDAHGQDAVRVFSEMEANGILWEPGTRNGKHVGARMIVTLRYNMVWALR